MDGDQDGGDHGDKYTVKDVETEEGIFTDEGADEQEEAHHPVKFARRFIRAGEEDAHHVQPDGDDHRVRAPAVDFTKEAEGYVRAKVLDVLIGVLDGRVI